MAEGLFINTKCEICDGKHLNKKDKQLMLCDICDNGYHRCCLKQTWIRVRKHAGKKQLRAAVRGRHHRHELQNLEQQSCGS